MRTTLTIAFAALVLATGAARAQDDDLTESPDGAEAVKIYFTEAEALAKVFAKADSLWVETWMPSEAEITSLQERLGWRVAPEEVRVHRGRRADEDMGFAVITEEKGRFKPITFLVKVAPAGHVEMVLVMVYRESRGDGVKRQRFLKQFRRKNAASSLRLNRDIVGVSGATLSSRGVTAGVKRVLALIEMRYGRRRAP